MSKNTLSFLENDNEELSNICEEVEKVIYSESHSAIINGRLFAEKLIIDIINKEDVNFILSSNQSEKIRYLNKEEYFDDEIARCFNNIRLIGNMAIHEGINDDIECAIKVHKNMYKLAAWYVEAYGKDPTLKVPAYSLPEFPKRETSTNENELENRIEELTMKRINELTKKMDIDKNVIERSTPKSEEDAALERKALEILGFKYEDEIDEEVKEFIVTELSDKERNVEPYIYKQSKGSYLLNELEKLNISAKEAVESSDGLGIFKRYIHIDRSIQKELVSSIEKAHESSEAQIVLLCGNVGDGKSHLLGYVNQIHSDIVSDFEIHNDATESFDPNLDEIETLKKVLEPFSDENIDTSKDKLILAINLGVLNNFLEEEYVKSNFTRLSSFINKSGIFEQEVIQAMVSDRNFKLVSFGDYSIFELTEDGPKSKYITSILNKIVADNEKNIFLNAYNKDIDNGVESPILENFKILSLSGVTERISNLVINVIVKYKKLISTREIFNFIYELLVPSNLEEYDMSSTPLDYNEALLPNILFGTKERGDLLKQISKEDPLKYRDENLDKLLIMLNISTDLNSVISRYMGKCEIEPLRTMLELVKNFDTANEEMRQEVTDMILRSLYLVGNDEIKAVFEEQAYIDYMKYLYFYNKGDLDSYIDLFDETKRAIFNWNGSPKFEYIYLKDNLMNYKVAELLEFEETEGKGICKRVKQTEIERFKNNINLDFVMLRTGDIESIEIDYQLYKKIVDVNKGYCPNRNDKEEAVRFIEFIDKIISYGNMEKELLVENTEKNEMFKLIYKTMRKSFEFRRLR
ncbi:DNA phosphorothioation-dependent restriction protein DptF [Clostridium sp. CH2]|uniref:DNA phosphorothioation-dependent restriction protein DptF n=1 Tax=Clostridium sp. CH2 TaxID=2949990 RepID=UPI002079ADCD|nr:DNA phosphorothioation-dependent restriction protein DptF [Clostridium sp. CH2]